MMLMRFDPFREVDRLAQGWDQSARARDWKPAMPIDAYRHGQDFVVHVDLPGVDASSVDVTVERNVLTVSARRKSPLADKARASDIQVLASERFHGEFSRQLLLGDSLDTDGIAATYNDGVLTLTIPVADKAKPRRVEVTTDAGSERHEVLTGSTA